MKRSLAITTADHAERLVNMYSAGLDDQSKEKEKQRLEFMMNHNNYFTDEVQRITDLVLNKAVNFRRNGIFGLENPYGGLNLASSYLNDNNFLNSYRGTSSLDTNTAEIVNLVKQSSRPEYGLRNIAALVIINILAKRFFVVRTDGFGIDEITAEIKKSGMTTMPNVSNFNVEALLRDCYNPYIDRMNVYYCIPRGKPTLDHDLELLRTGTVDSSNTFQDEVLRLLRSKGFEPNTFVNNEINSTGQVQQTVTEFEGFNYLGEDPTGKLAQNNTIIQQPVVQNEPVQPQAQVPIIQPNQTEELDRQTEELLDKPEDDRLERFVKSNGYVLSEIFTFDGNLTLKGDSPQWIALMREATVDVDLNMDKLFKWRNIAADDSASLIDQDELGPTGKKIIAFYNSKIPKFVEMMNRYMGMVTEYIRNSLGDKPSDSNINTMITSAGLQEQIEPLAMMGISDVVIKRELKTSTKKYYQNSKY